MAKVLQDLWIMTEDGITLFSRVTKKTVDEQLFGALLSALNSFAQEIANEGLQSFELSDKRFIFLRNNDLFFIGNSERSTKPKKLASAINKISVRFFERYSSDMFLNWDGDVSAFTGFEGEIDDVLEPDVEKFLAAL